MASSRSKLTRRRLFTLLNDFDRPISIRERGTFEDGVYFFISGKIRKQLVQFPKRIMGIAVSIYGFCSESLRPSCREKTAANGYTSFRKRVLERKTVLRRWIRQYLESCSEKEASAVAKVRITATEPCRNLISGRQL